MHPVDFPCLELVAVEGADRIGRFVDAVTSAARGDWLVFTSPNGVAVANRWLSGARTQIPAVLQVAAVGPSTAGRCRQEFSRCDLQPPADEARGEALGRLLAAQDPARAILAVARGGRRDVEEALRVAGWRVERFDLYETRFFASDATDRRHLEVDAVFLASPSAVAGLLAQARVEPDVPLFAIGPTTASAIEDAGLRPAGVAESPGLEALLDLYRQFQSGASQPLDIPVETIS